VNPPKLYFVPCSKQGGTSRAYRHFEETVLDSIPRAEYGPYTDAELGPAVSLWGATQGSKPQWEYLSHGDLLLFYVGDGRYQYAARVVGKEENVELAEALWSNDNSSHGGYDPTDPWKYLIYLNQPVEVQIQGAEIHGFAGHEIDYPPRFLKINEQAHQTIRERFDSVAEYIRARRVDVTERPENDPDDGTDSSSTSDDPLPHDTSPPERREQSGTRIVRDSEMVRELKRRYDYRCQVCGERRQRGASTPYAEGHHLHPLGDDPPGPDTKSNVLVLCPNHHADFDYGSIRVDPDTLSVRHLYDNSVDGRTLRVDPDHDPSRRHLQYHNIRADPQPENRPAHDGDAVGESSAP